jgi:mannose-6-phosphate isomerase-like protein (cupin superfamily)
MMINFNEIKEITVPGMNNGTGEMSAKMYMGDNGKIIPCRIHVGGSIGSHKHETSDDINYVISGRGKAVCDGKEEILTAGCCHICLRGSEHSIVNSGNEDLCLLTVVVERN